MPPYTPCAHTVHTLCAHNVNRTPGATGPCSRGARRAHHAGATICRWRSSSPGVSCRRTQLPTTARAHNVSLHRAPHCVQRRASRTTQVTACRWAGRGGRRTQGWHLQVDPSSRTAERCHTPCAHTVYPYCIDTPTQAPPRYLPAGWSCRLRVVYPGMAACRCGGCTQDTACRWPQSQWIQLSSSEDPIRVMATDTPRRGRTWKGTAPCPEKRGER